MRLAVAKYFGRKVWERRSAGLILTLSAYRPECVLPWHCHMNPTFFVVLHGDHRDHSRDSQFDQPAFSLVFHPTTEKHAGELGLRGARGLNIEFEPSWLARHELQESQLGRYRILPSAA